MARSFPWLILNSLLVDAVLPRQPLRQWVLSVPFPLRFLFATEPAALTAVLGIVYRAIAAHLIRKAGLTQSTAQSGAVTLIQRFGSALNLNIRFHMLLVPGGGRWGGLWRGYRLYFQFFGSVEQRPHLKRVPWPMRSSPFR